MRTEETLITQFEFKVIYFLVSFISLLAFLIGFWGSKDRIDFVGEITF